MRQNRSNYIERDKEETKALKRSSALFIGGALAALHGAMRLRKISKEDLEKAEEILEKKIRGEKLTRDEEAVLELLADKKFNKLKMLLGAIALLKGAGGLSDFVKGHDVVGSQ